MFYQPKTIEFYYFIAFIVICDIFTTVKYSYKKQANSSDFLVYLIILSLY